MPCCIICNVSFGPVMQSNAEKASKFLGTFSYAGNQMKEAASQLLELSKILKERYPEEAKRYDREHKKMVRIIREWNSIEHSRELPATIQQVEVMTENKQKYKIELTPGDYFYMSELGDYPSDRHIEFAERVSGLKVDASENGVFLISDKNTKTKQQKKRLLSYSQIMEKVAEKKEAL